VIIRIPNVARSAGSGMTYSRKSGGAAGQTRSTAPGSHRAAAEQQRLSPLKKGLMAQLLSSKSATNSHHPADCAAPSGLALPPGRELGRTGVEIVVGGLVAALVSLAVQ
jgi:hypothetical protein